jgi:hypothetical protein
MNPITKGEIAKWHFCGSLSAVACGPVWMILLEARGRLGSEDTFGRAALGSAVFIAGFFICTTPFLFPTLLGWARLARKFPQIESHRLFRFLGLTAIAVVLGVLTTGALKFIVFKQSWMSVFSTSAEDLSPLIASFSVFFIWAIAPRLAIPYLRGPIYLSA